MLLENNIEAVGYHAGMDAADRQWVQSNFIAGKAKVIVATNAFGLGIDKPDVRYVVHYDMPGTVEAYYQEAGRAGRDGRPSFCLLLYNSRDRALHEFFIKGDNPSINTIKEIYRVLAGFETDTVLITYSELSEMLSENMPDMAIGTALKLLEKEGYISRFREKNGSAHFKLLQAPDMTEKTFSSRSKKQAELFSSLRARYEDQMVEGWQANFEEIADILNIKKESLLRFIRALSKKGLAEYKPPFKGTEIKILKRIEPNDLKFDTAAIKEKLNRAYEKLDKVEDYVFGFSCRQKFILDYFGDEDSAVCGKCDICLGGKRHERKVEVQGKGVKKSFFASKKEKEREYDVSEPEKNSSLATKLTQLETLELYKKGLNIKEIAKARDLSEKDVNEHIEFLIKMKLIKPVKNKNG
jgi:ATP-dependent DNA helicase RecQ